MLLLGNLVTPHESLDAYFRAAGYSLWSVQLRSLT